MQLSPPQLCLAGKPSAACSGQRQEEPLCALIPLHFWVSVSVLQRMQRFRQADLENDHRGLKAFADFFFSSFPMNITHDWGAREWQKPFGMSVDAVKKRQLNFCFNIMCNLRYVRQESRVTWRQGCSWGWKYTFQVWKSMVLHCTGSAWRHGKGFCGIAWALQCCSACHKEGGSHIPKVMKLSGTELAFSEMPLPWQCMKIPSPGVALHLGKAFLSRSNKECHHRLPFCSRDGRTLSAHKNNHYF